MSCTAIATARAQVSQENLAALLTNELVSNVVFSFLKNKYPHLNPREDTQAWSGVDFVMGNYRIHIQGGAVTVSSNWNGDQATCTTLAGQVTAFLTKTAGLLFQQKTRQAISARYAITDEQRAQNGALVLSVEL